MREIQPKYLLGSSITINAVASLLVAPAQELLCLSRAISWLRSWHRQHLCFVFKSLSLTFRGFQVILTFNISYIPSQCLHRRKFLITAEKINALSTKDERSPFLELGQYCHAANSHTRTSLTAMTILTNVKSTAFLLVLMQEMALLLVLLVCDSAGRSLPYTDSVLKVTGSRFWKTSTPTSPRQPKPLHNMISPSPRLFQLSIHMSLSYPFLKCDSQDRVSQN